MSTQTTDTDATKQHKPVYFSIVGPIIATAIFVAISSYALSWTFAATFAVAAAMLIVIAALGPLLLPLLSLDCQALSERRKFLQTMLVIFVVCGAGIFGAVASHTFNWSEASTFVAVGGLVGVVSFLGTPLILLSDEKPAQTKRSGQKGH